MKHLFSGGIHPADKKELTCDKEIIILPAPEYVHIPLQQHIGAPCKAMVTVGEYVRMGQKIGDGDGLCVPVHASVSGIVEAIRLKRHPNGSMVETITIKNDGCDTPCEKLSLQRNPKSMDADELLKIIREAGIAGMGGAAFSTAVKASSSMHKADTLIINACECEPYITADDVLIQTHTEQVIRGIELISKVLKPEKVIFAIEDNKAKAIASVSEMLVKNSDIELRILPTRYPQGAEKQLIFAVTGREMPAGKLPADIGCAVFNVSTVAAVWQAVYLKAPLIRRIVTVTGEGVCEPKNMLVRIGTPFFVLIEAAGGLKQSAGRVIAGGPMMGMAQADLEASVIKGTGAIVCLETEATKEDEALCIRCGKCVEACPMHLEPLYFYRYQFANDLKMLDKFHVMDCMECGCCAYMCPGKLPLVESIRFGKRALREEKA